MHSSPVQVIGLNLSATALLVELARCAANNEVVGIDTETMGIDPLKQAGASGHGVIACWSVSTPKYPKVFLWADQLPKFTLWLESNAPKVGHNIYGFDYHMFANHGITLSGIVGDTLYMSRLLYCSKERKHGLKPLAENWLNIHQPSMKSLFTRPKHTIEFVQEQRKSKGEVVLLEYRESKRKVGEQKGVPTLFATGERGKFGLLTEFIPLTDIPTVYPERLEALYEYASLDALLTRLLFHRFSEELSKVEWKVQK